MSEIKHRHRLEGLDGGIDPQGSDWRAGGEHLVLWRAEGLDDPDAAASRLRSVKGEATLEYLARGDGAEEVVERDRVEIIEVRLEGDALQAVLRVTGKDG